MYVALVCEKPKFAVFESLRETNNLHLNCWVFDESCHHFFCMVFSLLVLQILYANLEIVTQIGHHPSINLCAGVCIRQWKNWSPLQLYQFIFNIKNQFPQSKLASTMRTFRTFYAIIDIKYIIPSSKVESDSTQFACMC